jgi:hypothetical protein
MTTRHNPMFAVAFCILAASSLLGEVIDRIVVVVNGKFIITLSDIRKERAIQAALGSDLGNDEAVADWLVEKQLIEEQITQFLSAEIPENLVAEQLSNIKTPAGVSEKEIRQAVESKLRRGEFMNQRFGQFVRVSDEELANYYEKTLAPEFRLRGEPVPPLESVSEMVRRNVIIERMNNEFNTWREELVGRATIEKIPQ